MNPYYNLLPEQRFTQRFVEQFNGGGPLTNIQTLRLHYTDWAGDAQQVELVPTDTGYQFLGVSDSSSTSPINPDTCLSDQTCFKTPALLYRGADGRPPSSVQISARVHNYPRMFTIDRRTRPHTVRLREDMQRANSGDDGGASGRPSPRPDEVAGSVMQEW